MQTLTRQNLIDILYGCTILGTGGGGSLAEGIDLIDRALAKGKTFRLCSLDDVPDDDRIATPYMCGAISPDTQEELAKYADLPRTDESFCLLAYEEMERVMGQPFQGVISTELGGGNTAQAFYVGAMLGKYIVDADPAGRSVPELQHSTYFIHGLPIAPIALANAFGETAVLQSVVNDFRAEAMVRALAVVSQNSIGVVDHPCTGRELKPAVIPGAISQARRIGEAHRLAKEQGLDPVAAICASEGGRRLFTGRVESFNWDTVDGFTVGDVTLAGYGNDAGQTLRIWFKNEHIIAWLNGAYHVTVPDLICLIDHTSGEPVTNPYYTRDQAIDAFVLPAPSAWQSDKGLAVFGPRSFGFEVDYRPFTS